MDAFLKDLAFGLRQLRLNPMFTAVAVLSLALGVGANTAIFQLIDAIQLRSLAVGSPQDLAYIDFTKDAKRGAGGPREARISRRHNGIASKPISKPFPDWSRGAPNPSILLREAKLTTRKVCS